MQVVTDARTGHAVAVQHVYPGARTVLVRECAPHTYRLAHQGAYLVRIDPPVTEFPCIHCRRLLAANR